MDVLKVKIDTTMGKLTFSRQFMLGSEYTVAFDPPPEPGDPQPVLVICNNECAIICTSDAQGEIKLDTLGLIDLFADGKSPRSQCVKCYAYAGTTVLGSGLATLQYTPLSFASGQGPEVIQGIATLVQDHIADKNNPHEVTLVQLGAAPAVHSHNLADNYIIADGRYFRMKFAHIGGQLTHYYEEFTP